MQRTRQFATWLWKAWPILVVLFLVAIHLLALGQFRTQGALINKVAGTCMQVIGGGIVLWSINANLGLFRDKTILAIIGGWLRACPLGKRNVTIALTGVASAGASASASLTVIRGPGKTLEERIARTELEITELRADLASHRTALEVRIEVVRSELSSSLASHDSRLGKLSDLVDKATVGSFKQQAFGVLLVIYGAALNIFPT